MDPHTSPTTARVAPDAIVRVRLGDFGHLLVVRRSLNSHLIVSPLHPYREYATHADVLVERAAGHPYPVIVHLGMEGCIDHAQVDRAVGYLTPGWIDGPRGPQLQGPLDARAQFLAAQRDWFIHCTAECTARLLFELD